MFPEPTVGSKHGAVGVGLEGDYTLWADDCSNSDFVVMSELSSLFRFKHKKSVFDLNNVHYHAVLLAAPESNPFAPVSLLPKPTILREVYPRSQIEWWLGVHYQWCNWGLEAAYNLYWRDCERIKCPTFNFDDLGLFVLILHVAVP